jgi:NTP pyrophosphatase (non-canonical NTP hydrolase)
MYPLGEELQAAEPGSVLVFHCWMETGRIWAQQWQTQAFVFEVPARLRRCLNIRLMEQFVVCTLQAACQVENKNNGGIARVRTPVQAPGMAALSDNDTSVAELKSRVLAFARARDWEQFHSPKNLSMALAAEAAELMEHFLWATPEQSKGIAQDPAKRARIAEELADVVIYALEFANATNLDVAAAVEAKIALNAAKYPVEKARGRADKYTEL